MLYSIKKSITLFKLNTFYFNENKMYFILNKMYSKIQKRDKFKYNQPNFKRKDIWFLC
jgi:hypothetical protein